jgi:uncharacterized membrane protein YhiD involved in acid resistance
VHPVVRRLGIGAILWTVAAIWILFNHSYYGVLLFGVVTLLVVVFVAVPWLLFRLGRRDDTSGPSFREWMDSDFDTASGPVNAREAAVLILLVPLSIALGMTAFGVLAYLSSVGVL